MKRPQCSDWAVGGVIYTLVWWGEGSSVRQWTSWLSYLGPLPLSRVSRLKVGNIKSSLIWWSFLLITLDTYVCPAGTSSETIVLNKGKKLTFKTQSGKKTPNNLDCSVTYTMGTCSKAKLACNFKMNGRGKDCPKGDKVLYTYGTTTKAYVVLIWY